MNSYCCLPLHCRIAWQRQTAVTDWFTSKQLLLFAFARGRIQRDEWQITKVSSLFTYGLWPGERLTGRVEWTSKTSSPAAFRTCSPQLDILSQPLRRFHPPVARRRRVAGVILHSRGGRPYPTRRRSIAHDHLCYPPNARCPSRDTAWQGWQSWQRTAFSRPDQPLGAIITIYHCYTAFERGGSRKPTAGNTVAIFLFPLSRVPVVGRYRRCTGACCLSMHSELTWRK